MSSSKFTKRYVESIKPKKKEFFVWDSEIKGLGLRVRPSGIRCYFVQYRNSSARTRRQRLGFHGVITADQAREQAKDILSQVSKGVDTSKERHNLKLIPSFSQFAVDYLSSHSKPHKKVSSYNEDKRLIEKALIPAFRDKLISEIETKDVQAFHNGYATKPYLGNRTLALLRNILNYSIEWGYRKDNPANNIRKYQEQKRTRWLTHEEMDRLWKVLESYHDQKIANIYRLLLLTGSRRGEALNATWDQFDLEKGVWTKPAHTTKQKRMEHLPLSSLAISLLKNMKETSDGSKFLFPGRVEGEPVKEIKKGWATIRKLAEIEDVRIHDLRHTYASHLVSKGLSLSVVGKLLGHTQASTTQRYAHLADEPLRQATEMFGENLGKAS